MKRSKLPCRFAKAQLCFCSSSCSHYSVPSVSEEDVHLGVKIILFLYFNEHTRNNNLWNQKNWNKLIQFNSIKEEPKIFGEKKNTQMLSIDDNTNLLRNDEWLFKWPRNADLTWHKLEKTQSKGPWNFQRIDLCKLRQNYHTHA